MEKKYFPFFKTVNCLGITTEMQSILLVFFTFVFSSPEYLWKVLARDTATL